MQLTTSWQLIATDAGALIQKHGTNSITLGYHASAPVDNTFGLNHNQPLLLPAVAGKNIYGKVQSGTAEISFEVI